MKRAICLLMVLVLGISQGVWGQYAQALEYSEQALSINREIGERYGEGNDLSNLGIVYNELGQYARALESYKQALAIHREFGDRPSEGNALANIGGVYMNLGGYPQALDYYEQALAIKREIGDRYGEGMALTNLGLVYRNLGQYKDASTAFQQSLSIYEALGPVNSLWYAQRGLASVEVHLDQPESAITHYEQALDTIEALRAGLPETITQRELDLELQLEHTRKQLADERSKIITEQNKELINNLEQRENTLKAEQAALQERIKTDYPDYYALRYPTPVTLADLQQQVLEPGEILLVYGVMQDKTCLWVIGQEEFGLYGIDISEDDLTEKVEAFRNQVTEPILEAIARKESSSRLRRIAKRSIDAIHQTSHELCELLMPPEVQPLIAQAETLYIVPTGTLYGLPFETLSSPSPQGKRTDSDVLQRREPEYLIEDHGLVYLSSASLLRILREAQSRRTTEARYPLLAFANPMYNLAKVSEPSQGLTTDTSLKDLTTRAYLDLMGGGFTELPDTEEEVKNIQAILNAPEESHPVYLREDAARSTVFQLQADKQLEQYRYVVFSCHGILPGDITQVTPPALVLSLPDPATQQEEYLTMADVFGLHFNADLVTLSACNTGRGQQVHGEGVMGLSRAFMYAGTPAISITLWSVESQSATLLSTGLYRYLQDGRSRAEALRQSKLRLIRGEEDSLYQHPFFWAAVIMFGDGR